MSANRTIVALAALLVALAACDEDKGNTPLFPGPCTQENDNNADGLVDLRIVYTYDDAGLLVLRETDSLPESDLDGIPEGASHYYYEGDLLVRKEVDYGANDSIELYYFFIYDEQDWLTSVEVKGDPDAELDALYEFTYDESGNNIEAVYSFYMGEETEQDIEYYTFDADDNLVAEEIDFDAHLGEGIDERHYHQLDSESVRYRTDRDLDGDFVIDAVTYYNYDSQGLLVLEETDTGPDQVIDKAETYDWDGGGNLTKYVLDEGADGWEDEIQRFGYGCW